jgi:hypothetical protein
MRVRYFLPVLHDSCGLNWRVSYRPISRWWYLLLRWWRI